MGDLGDAREGGVDVGIGMRRTELQRRVALPLNRLDDEDVARARVDGTLERRHADAADADHRDVVAGADVTAFTAEP